MPLFHRNQLVRTAGIEVVDCPMVVAGASDRLVAAQPAFKFDSDGAKTGERGGKEDIETGCEVIIPRRIKRIETSSIQASPNPVSTNARLTVVGCVAARYMTNSRQPSVWPKRWASVSPPSESTIIRPSTAPRIGARDAHLAADANHVARCEANWAAGDP